MAAEAVGQEVVQRDLLLTHEAAVRQPAFAHQIDHGADAGGGGDLDAGPVLAVDLLVQDRAREDPLGQASGVLTDGGDEDLGDP